jgi:phospholipase C
MTADADQGDDVDALTPNQDTALAAGESEADDETAAAYAGAEEVDTSTVSDDLDPTADDDITEAADQVDGLPGARHDVAFPDDAIPVESAMAAVTSKIKYVLVIVKENHTFDNYFTGFSGASWSKKAKISSIETECRPIAPEGTIGTPCHTNCCGRHAYSGGSMDGFESAGTSCGASDQGLYPYIRYREDQIPNYWRLAKDFVLADHYFSTTLGPSAPGHEVFWFSQSTSIGDPKCTGGNCSGSGCDSKGITIEAMNPLTCSTQRVKPCFDLPVLPQRLPSGFTWMDYGNPIAAQSKWVHSQPNWQKHFRGSTSLAQDIHDGKQANLTIAHVSGGPSSEHPPEDPCHGENYTVKVIKEAMASPHWNEMAIFVTWDDWGGFYDHVKPSVHVCKNGQEFENGFRLPLIIVSPYAKKGVVLHDDVEQASIPKFIENQWNMGYMHDRNKHARDEVAGGLHNAFDFNQAPRAPITLTERATCPSKSGKAPKLRFPKPVDGQCE